jgi:hypothetical protein
MRFQWSFGRKRTWRRNSGITAMSRNKFDKVTLTAMPYVDMIRALTVTPAQLRTNRYRVGSWAIPMIVGNRSLACGCLNIHASPEEDAFQVASDKCSFHYVVNSGLIVFLLAVLKLKA